jgi:hypothetical protein
MMRTLAVLAAAMAAGCVHERNESLALHDTILMEALGPERPGIALTSESPSVTRIDRSGWEPTTVVVPVDGTAHFPTYVRVFSTVKETRRQRGEYATELSALDLDGGSESKQQLEAVTQPFRALGNALLILPRMIFYRRPWQTLQSPRQAYERDWLRPGIERNPACTATAPQP